MEEDGVGLWQTSTGLPLRCPCSVRNQKLLVSFFNLRKVLQKSHPLSYYRCLLNSAQIMIFS